MDEVVIASLVALLLLTVVSGVSAALVVLTVLRAVRQAQLRMQDGVDRARLRARSYGIGPAAEVARLRLELAAAIHDVRRALACAVTARVPVGDAPSLVRRLDSAAAGVDAELRTAGLERDPARLAAVLPILRSRAAAVTASASSVRRGLLQSSLRVGDAELRALGADCAVEAQALSARIRTP